MIWNIRKKKTTDQNSKNQKGIQKIKDRLRSLWDNFKCYNIWIIGVPEREEKEQKIENLFENIIKENFPIWQKK